MMRAEREPLSGDVDVDETRVGVEHGRRRGRRTAKSLVVIAVEIKPPKGFGRTRTNQAPDASWTSLVTFVRNVVAPGSVVLLDGWRGYNPLPRKDDFRKNTVLLDLPDPPRPPCHECTGWTRCSSGGSSAPIGIG